MDKQEKKKSRKRAVIELAIFSAVFLGLYATGTLPHVAGFVQGLIVKTRLIRPDSEPDFNGPKADYNFTLVSADGQRVPFSQFKGKTVFLNFWASWCPPCVAEMPDIQALYERAKTDSDIVFVMVTADKKMAKAQKFFEKKGYDMPLYKNVSALPAVFNHSSIPSTFVISPSGQVTFSHSGMAYYNTDSFLEMLQTLGKTQKNSGH
ncbi:hypothetical protein FUAX_23580 [Fulvitalea axinellae]|uniref:Thioredoxin domain-containing protein n=1 Tax=Fulvitalea axinellae TaxID=1182444 RepID=A0AAU9DAH1_9BACT|nr:hypothetical protein FUAX_23580 [Fulvitalea axinellae]